eukprot:6494986-Ditylum_brightwellii.AAC.1
MQHPTHISMVRLAECGTISTALKHIRKVPPCAECIFDKAQKKAWRTKGSRKSLTRKKHHSTPGKGTSADHMISHQPDLMPQVTGKLTHERYWGTVTMVDHASSYSYSHFIMGATNEQRVAAKLAYERVLREYGHNVESYHGNNSRFDSEDFINPCKEAQQSYSYCGIGGYHQNGIAENINKCLTPSARTILLHTKRKWIAVISTVLWPFAYRAAEDRHNKLD